MLLRDQLASASRPLRRKLGLVPAPTLPPGNARSTSSDLFIWRAGGGWSTIFEALNLGYLLNPLGPKRSSEHVVLHLRDHEGRFIDACSISVEPGKRSSTLVAEFLNDTPDERYGTFSVSHSEVPSRLKEFGTYLTDRGYCGYAAPGQLSRSYVHGNLDAIAHDDRGATPRGARSLGLRQYAPQYCPEPGIHHEFGLVNPTKRVLNVKVLQIQGRSVQESTSLAIPPLGSILHHISSNQPGTRYAFVSKLWLCRPVIFAHTGGGLDVFHG